MWWPIAKDENFKELPPATRAIFLQFANCANRRALHPLDWKRFYRFIRFCHAKRVKLQSWTLRELLIRAHFPDHLSAHLANIYEHSRELLAAP